jgi:putative ABC transport system ATP-binding protein
MIELRGITRSFLVGGRPVHALRGIDLAVAAGEYVSIMGPSGSGKSTLLNIIGCLDRPSAGSYRLDGRETADLSEIELSRVRRHKIGFVFQFFHLVPRLTAVQNVELPMIFAGIEPRDRQRRIDAALDSVGLSERRDHRPDQLSGGERQRVAIARAIVMEPAVVLADEPTGNLDSSVGREIIELLERMNAGGLTLLIVTHDPEVGGRSRRQVRLADGRVISDGAGAARPVTTGRDPATAADPGGRP